MLRCLTLILTLLQVNSARAQSQDIDSLRHALADAPRKNKGDILFQIATAYSQTHPDSALYCIERAMFYETDSVSITKLFRAKGVIMTRLNRQQEIAEILEPIVSFAERERLDNHLVDIYDMIATSRTLRGEYRDALKWVYKLIPLLDTDSINRTKHYVYNNLGILFYKIRDNQRALHYYKIAEDRSVNPHPFLLVNTALAYAELGSVDDALTKLRNARSTCDAFGQKNAMTQLHFAFGLTFIKSDQLDSAAFHLEKSMKYAKETGDTRMHAESLVYHARVHIQQNRLDSAINLLNEAESLAVNNELNEVMLDVFRQFVIAYENLKEYDLLSQYQSAFVRLKEELYEGEIVRDIALAEGRMMELDHQQELINQRKKIEIQEEFLLLQKWASNAEIAIVALMGTLAIVLSYRNQEQRKTKNLLAEKVRLRTEELRRKRIEMVLRSEQIKDRLETLEQQFVVGPGLIRV